MHLFFPIDIHIHISFTTAKELFHLYGHEKKKLNYEVTIKDHGVKYITDIKTRDKSEKQTFVHEMRSGPSKKEKIFVENTPSSFHRDRQKQYLDKVKDDFIYI